MSPPTDIADLLKQVGAIAHKARDLPVNEKQKLGEALAAIPGVAQAPSVILIDELAQIIDYRAYFEWGVYRDQMLADGKDEATAAKMADYHWLNDKKIARFKAGQILERIAAQPPASLPTMEQLREAIADGWSLGNQLYDDFDEMMRLRFDAAARAVIALAAQPPAAIPTNLPHGWEYQVQTNSVVCGGCLFRYGAEHSASDGNWICPNCGDGNGKAAQPPAAPSPGTVADRSAIAQTFLDEDYQDKQLDSFDMADIMLRHWDVRWKGAQPPAAAVNPKDFDRNLSFPKGQFPEPAAPVETDELAARLRKSADHDGPQELKMVMRRVATALERRVPANSSAETVDALTESCRAHVAETALREVRRHCETVDSSRSETLIAMIKRTVDAALSVTGAQPQEAPQPIETAPKDGSHILAWRVPIGIRFTNNTNPPTVVHWFDDPEEPGFYTSVNELAPEHPFNPTHWMPLPAGPSLSRPHRGGSQ